MRNLKKILALVLALVMSLSLMATAGASQFPDVDEGNPYATAIDVLDELKVFQGFDDGTFKPTETLNRAQAAVLVYRIATGDVENKYLDNYTFMQQSKFTDLDGYNWAKGYINYCQNAGIVVGTSSTTFDPGAKVTGYQLLVMLLRTLGYGKAGEFADPKGWELKTATIAESEGITKNVTSGDFGAPAPRQMVAEILFRGLLTETVEYSALIPGGYTKSGETLGMREFGLEKVSGVVMANQWANIKENGTKVLADDTTEMLVKNGEDSRSITLTIGTDLDAVGMSYDAYIAGKGTAKNALTMEPSSSNKVAFNNGEGIKVSKLAENESLSVGDAVYFTNYDEDYDRWDESDYLIRYRVTLATERNAGPAAQGVYRVVVDSDVYDYLIEAENINVSYPEMTNGYYNKTPDTTGGKTISGTGEVSANAWGYAKGAYPAPGANYEQKALVAVRTIKPGAKITQMDLDIMKEIFYSADRNKENPSTGVEGYIEGEVYVGTSSLEDKSDIMSWKEFTEKYFDANEKAKFDACKNGESLRIIDNNGDGSAEYILKVEYWQDKAIDTYKDALEYYKLGLSNRKVVYVDEIAVGDMVNYTDIDGKLTIYKADVVTDTITTKSFRDTTVTPASGEPIGQSEIYNNTPLAEDIMLMDDKTEYNMYLDEFGYIRTYELAQGSQYALLTEMYRTGTQNWNYVNTLNYTAEVKIGEADVEEMTVANPGNRRDGLNPFISSYAWTGLYGSYSNGADLNFLQPAIAHLDRVVPAGVNAAAKTALESNYFIGATNGTTTKDYIEWDRAVFPFVSKNPAAPATPAGKDYGVFDYGPLYDPDSNSAAPVMGDVSKPVEHTFSFTNVASYTMADNGINLKTAAQLSINKDGEQLYYGPSQGGAEKFARKDTIEGWAAKGVAESQTAWDTETEVENLIGTTFWPVYAVDYVQLAKDSVANGQRHFYIQSSGSENNFDYSEKYHTNSNGYVNALDTTEFYIVTPTGISYEVGYDALPKIDASSIRAAYAVAQNTAKDRDGLDYWVADVIVIETTGPAIGWDSVSLMYYNPWETSNTVRYVDTLNNEWRTYQADSDKQAMIGVVPNVDNNGGFGWGNREWNGYGFYALKQSEYADGQIAAGRLEQITSNYGDYGIYAGTIQRMNSISGSRYIDVDTQGRAYVDGTNGINDENVIPVQIDYANDYKVPVYRVDGDDTTEVRLALVEGVGYVQAGDQIIWVYNKAANRVAFIVDLGARGAVKTDSDYYRAPSYLINYAAATTDLTTDYGRIISGQPNKIVGTSDVVLPYSLAANETITFTPDGGKSTTYTAPTTGPLTGAYTLTLSDKLALTSITVKWGGGATPGAIVPGTGLNPQWSILRVEAVSGDPNARKIVLINNTIDSAQTKSLMPGLDEGELAICLYSKAAVQALVTMAGKTIGTEGAPADVEAAQELLDELNGILDSNELDNSTVLGSDLADQLETNAGTLGDQIEDATTEITVAVSVSDTDNLTVDPTSLTLGADGALSGKSVTLAVKAGATGKALPESITSITVGGSALDSANYSYDKATGKITFSGGTAAGNDAIVITATAGESAGNEITATVSVSDTTNLEVAPASLTLAADGALSGKSVTLSVKASATGKALPESITSITVGGSALDAANYSYDKATGKITFSGGTAADNDAIVITATAGESAT